MLKPYVMPKLGHLMEEGTVTSWHKGVGDALHKGDIFLLIETEKTTVEVDSPFDGILSKILVQAGQTAAVGTPLALIDVADGPA